MVTAEEALARVLDHIRPLPIVHNKPIAATLGQILAAPVSSCWPLPQVAVSVMDGYAVHGADIVDTQDPPKLPVVGESAAGHPFTGVFPQGTCIKVSTGAAVPSASVVVVPREEAQSSPESDLIQFSTDAVRSAERGRFVRRAGSDVSDGERLLDSGILLSPGDLALAASSGHRTLPVHRVPRVAVLCTGDELIAIGETPQPGQIIGTNGMMLAMQIRAAGGVPVMLDDASDHPDALNAAFDRALICDLLVTSGGISVGAHDLVYRELTARGFITHFRKARLRPGKPTTFGTLPRSQSPGLPVLALPGNPASTYVTFELFGGPAIRRLSGYPIDRCALPRRRVRLAAPAHGEATRTHFVRARVVDNSATPLATQTSGDLRSISGHNALLVVPEGQLETPAGSYLDAILLRYH